jgi:hypothetical protein
MAIDSAHHIAHISATFIEVSVAALFIHKTGAAEVFRKYLNARIMPDATPLSNAPVTDLAALNMDKVVTDEAEQALSQIGVKISPQDIEVLVKTKLASAEKDRNRDLLKKRLARWFLLLQSFGLNSLQYFAPIATFLAILSMLYDVPYVQEWNFPYLSKYTVGSADWTRFWLSTSALVLTLLLYFFVDRFKQLALNEKLDQATQTVETLKASGEKTTAENELPTKSESQVEVEAGSSVKTVKGNAQQKRKRGRRS